MLIRINSPAFAPFGGTIGRHLTTIASGIRRVCLPGTRSGTPAYGTHTGVGFNFRTFRLLTRVRDLLRLPDTHTHTHTHTQMRAHTCTRHLATFTFAAFAPFGDTIGRHLTTIASGFRRVCLPGTRSGTPAYGTHTGVGFNFRTFRLLTRVRDLLRLPQTHTRTRARPRGRTSVRVTGHYCEWF